MRILFIGGFLRGLRLLERLVERRFQVVGAFICEEDPHESAVYSSQIVELCRDNGIPSEVGRRITASRAAEIRSVFAPDVMFCLGWRTLLPDAILEAAPRGVVAVHDSLLPRMRGFAPANWSLLLANQRLGCTLFQMTHGMDEGDIYFQESFEASPDDTLDMVVQRLSGVATGLFEKYLEGAAAGTLTTRPQAHHEATYCCARNPEDGEIDWALPAEAIARQVRSLAPPSPGAFTFYKGEQITILSAEVPAGQPTYEGRVKGRIVAINRTNGSVDVLCGVGILRVLALGLDSGQIVPAAELCKSVRESLGLNVSHEIMQLRDTVRMLETRLALLDGENTDSFFPVEDAADSSSAD
jgi:methionyl-tRNA formyltransferase